MKVSLKLLIQMAQKDTVKVPVEVTDNRADADKYEPTVDKEVVEIGGNG